MKNIFLILLLGFSLAVNAQNERKHIRQGVKAYDGKTWSESEIDFREALTADSTSMPAKYDMGNALYKQDKFKDAGKIFEQMSADTKDIDDSTLADIYHNLGNSLLKQGDYARSIDAYKKSLRIRPSDGETRYNLAYAQAKLKDQQKKDQDKKDQQDKKKDQDKKDKKKDQDKQNQQDKKKDQDQQNQKKEQENKDKQQQQQNQNKQDQKNQKQKQQNAQPQKQLSKEDMQKMLQAIQQQELKTLQKYEKEKAKAKQVKTEKDW